MKEKNITDSSNGLVKKKKRFLSVYVVIKSSILSFTRLWTHHINRPGIGTNNQGKKSSMQMFKKN